MVTRKGQKIGLLAYTPINWSLDYLLCSRHLTKIRTQNINKRSTVLISILLPVTGFYCLVSIITREKVTFWEPNWKHSTRKFSRKLKGERGGGGVTMSREKSLRSMMEGQNNEENRDIIFYHATLNFFARVFVCIKNGFRVRGSQERESE